jgi:hypothetical protein
MNFGLIKANQIDYRAIHKSSKSASDTHLTNKGRAAADSVRVEIGSWNGNVLVSVGLTIHVQLAWQFVQGMPLRQRS